MDYAALDVLLAKMKAKNATNPFFKSKLEAIAERQQKDDAGEFYRLSEAYLSLSLDDKKKVINLITLAQNERLKTDKRIKAIFYKLNAWKRSNRWGATIFPGYGEHKISYHASFIPKIRSIETALQKPKGLSDDAQAVSF